MCILLPREWLADNRLSVNIYGLMTDWYPITGRWIVNCLPLFPSSLNPSILCSNLTVALKVILLNFTSSLYRFGYIGITWDSAAWFSPSEILIIRAWPGHQDFWKLPKRSLPEVENLSFTSRYGTIKNQRLLGKRVWKVVLPI